MLSNVTPNVTCILAHFYHSFMHSVNHNFNKKKIFFLLKIHVSYKYFSGGRVMTLGDDL